MNLFSFVCDCMAVSLLCMVLYIYEIKKGLPSVDEIERIYLKWRRCKKVLFPIDLAKAISKRIRGEK